MGDQRFIRDVVETARQRGFKIETNRDGLVQIDFGNKKLHAGHLSRLFPDILEAGADVAGLIERVAPGRPCTHRPMREIISELGRIN